MDRRIEIKLKKLLGQEKYLKKNASILISSVSKDILVRKIPLIL
ncbi:MAG: hypothetical protein AABX34_04305 [Nanoarchaeota archaeon]